MKPVLASITLLLDTSAAPLTFYSWAFILPGMFIANMRIHKSQLTNHALTKTVLQFQLFYFKRV